MTDTGTNEILNNQREQRVGNMKVALLLLCIAVVTQSMMVSGAFNVSISTIERLYRYKSILMAFIETSYNIGFAISAFLIGSYVTSRKMAWIGGGMFLIGWGCLIFISPILMVHQNYLLFIQKSVLCESGPHSDDNTCSGSSNIYLIIMCLSYGLIGVGAAPLHTLCISFIEENTLPFQNGLYNGIYYSSAALGPAITFVLFSFVIKLPLKLHMESNSIITSADENWVGAYWLIYVLGSIMAFSISLPLFLYPKRIASARSTVPPVQIPFTLRRLLVTLKKVFTNRNYILNSIAMFLDGMMNNAIGIFLANYIEIQFQITPEKAALFAGIIIVVGAVGGLFLGGLLIRLFNLRPPRLIKIIAMIFGICMISLSFLFIRCTDKEIRGVTFVDDQLKFDNDIADQCHCDIKQYFPVCVHGTDWYYNVCLIGCKKKNIIGSDIYFSNCSNQYGKTDVSVKKGRCDLGCSFLTIFIIFGFICLVFEFSSYVPQITYTMRILEDDSRLFGLSIQQIILRISYTLGPFYLGQLFDYSCKIFNPLRECESSSNCIIYDLKKLSLSVALPAIGLKGLATSFLLLSVYLDSRKNIPTIQIEPPPIPK